MGEAGSSAEFKLVVSSMDEAVIKIQELAKSVQSLKGELNEYIIYGIDDWQGQGRNMFERKYKLIMRQLKDMSEEIYDIGEDLLTAAEAYIQADMDSAKGLAKKMGGR